VARLRNAAGRIVGAGVLAAALSGCPAPAPPARPPQAPSTSQPSPTPPAPRATQPEPAPVAPAPAPVPQQRALVIENGRETWIDAEKAAASGYTIVDLSDDWSPYIFALHHAPTGEPLPNRYRRVFLGLANDQLDEDGQPLAPGQKNYLELYGVFPSLSVVRARFIEDSARSCDHEKPGHKKKAAPLSPMAQAEHRLTCEGFLSPAARHHAGKLDDPMWRALRAFQQKHMIYEGHALQPRTVEALKRPLLENDHRSLVRAMRERVISAAAIIEDGSVEGKGGQSSFTSSTGRVPMRNLADEYTNVALQQLGLDTPEQALAFFQRHPATDFGHLWAAVKLPALPEYYGPEMDLSIVIDRGDVWYDLPFDATGAYKPQGRKKYPQFTLYVTHGKQKIMLAKWRTTIGGWRAEQASDGYEYFRYKGSDVGPRVIRNVVAGPVWIAPTSTPIRGLVKSKVVRGKSQQVVNYDELGPGYLSAYGLIAGYIVTPGVNGRGDFDNGVRLHGSSEYLSMYSANGFSHGCHRLPNHLAIRLYSFILRHRPIRIVGDQPMDFARQFLKGDDAFEIRIASRGYSYVLDPPLPIEVLEGEIKGEVKNPIMTYVPKPGIAYPGPPPAVPNGPESRAGGAAAGGRRNADDDEEKP
jgi:hypothetical protein